jgi:hypothetical protein
MEHYAGIDVSLESSSMCVVDATGRVVREAKIASELECAPAGGQFERKDLTQPAGLPEDGSHDELPISQCCIQAAGR